MHKVKLFVQVVLLFYVCQRVEKQDLQKVNLDVNF